MKIYMNSYSKEKIKAKIDQKTSRIARKISKENKVYIGIKTRFMFWFYGGMQKADWVLRRMKRI